LRLRTFRLAARSALEMMARASAAALRSTARWRSWSRRLGRIGRAYLDSRPAAKPLSHPCRRVSVAYAYPKISPGSETGATDACRVAAEATASTQHPKTAGQAQASRKNIKRRAISWVKASDARTAKIVTLLLPHPKSTVPIRVTPDAPQRIGTTLGWWTAAAVRRRSYQQTGHGQGSSAAQAVR
jgi:hypothetical protein